MSRPPLFRSALWVRERACAPLIAVEAPKSDRTRIDAVAELGRRQRRKREVARRAA